MIKSEFILDITAFQNNLKKAADESAVAGRQISKSIQDATAKGIKPVVDTSEINKLVNSYKSAELQTKLFVKEQKEVLAALKFSGQGGSKAFKEIENQIKSAEKELTKFNHETTKSGNLAERTANSFKSSFASITNIAAGFTIAGIAEKGISALTGAIGGLFEQARKADEIGTKLEIGFRNAGLTGEELSKQINDSEKAARKLGFAIGVAPERLKELASQAATLGGATGRLNDDFVKASIGIEKATAGAVSGEAAIKLFSKGIQDPENVEALSKLKSQFPLLATELNNITDPTLKAQKTIELLSGTFIALENDTKDVFDGFANLKNQFGEIVQSFGGSVLANFNLDNLRDQFGDFDIEDVVDKVKEAGAFIGRSLSDIANSVISAFSKIKPVIMPIIAAIGAVITTVFISAKNTIIATYEVIEAVFDALNEAIVEPIKEAFGAIGDEAINLGEVIDDLDKYFRNITGIIVELVKIAITPFTFALKTLIGIIGNVITFLQNLFKPASDVKKVIGDLSGETSKSNKVLDGFTGTLVKIRATLSGVAEMVRTVSDALSNFYKSLVSFDIKAAINAFSGLGKKVGEAYNKGWNEVVNKETQKQLDKTAEKANEVEKKIDTVSNKPLAPTKKAINQTIDNLTDYVNFINTLRNKIDDIDFNITLKNFDAQKRAVELQLNDLKNRIDVSELDKLDIQLQLETSVVEIELERQLLDLQRIADKRIADINKELEAKRNETVKSKRGEVEIETAKFTKEQLIAFEEETQKAIELIQKDTALSYEKIIEERDNRLKVLNEKRNKDVISLETKQANVIKSLQIDLIENERARNYEKELLALKQKFDEEQKLYADNQEIITLLTTKYNKDLEQLNKKYTDTNNRTLDNLTKFVDTFNKKVSDLKVNSQSESLNELRKEGNLLTDSLKNRTITYENYINGLNDIDKKRIDLQKQNIDLQKKTEMAFLSASAEFFANYSTQISDDLTKSFTLSAEKSEGFFDVMNNSIESTTNLLVSNFAVALSEGDSLLKSLGKSVVNTAQVLLNAWAAPLLLKKNTELPFGLGSIAFGVLLASANALLSLAKSGLGGAEEGVIELTKATKGRPGRTDTIPMLLAPGESVINANMTKKYKDVLKLINEGGLSNTYIDSTGKINSVVNSNMGSGYAGGNNNGLNNEIRRLSSNVRKLEKQSYLRMDFEFDNRTKLSGDTLEIVTTKAKRKKLRRF
jgi:hypothetical protein